MKKNLKKDKINEDITNATIRLTGEFNGELVTLREALTEARNAQMDLVLISEVQGVGICKIMNYQKYLYELSKKPKVKVVDTKEVKFGPNTGDNDVEYRLKQIIGFLAGGHKVKISMQFKGRQMAHVDLGEKLMNGVVESLEAYSVVETPMKMEGKRMFVLLRPKSK